MYRLLYFLDRRRNVPLFEQGKGPHSVSSEEVFIDFFTSLANFDGLSRKAVDIIDES